MCQEIRFGDCPAHGPLHAVRPSITLPESQKSYAVSTFPDEVGLCISSIPLAGFGVFARHFIPLGTWIGPYEGLKISIEEGVSRPQQQNFMWEVRGKQFQSSLSILTGCSVERMFFLFAFSPTYKITIVVSCLL